jgi:hypothetical protein
LFALLPSGLSQQGFARHATQGIVGVARCLVVGIGRALRPGAKAKQRARIAVAGARCLVERVAGRDGKDLLRALIGNVDFLSLHNIA